MFILDKKGTLIDDKLYSQFLQQEIPIIVYVPHHYTHLQSYPVLYVQDGDDYITLGKLISTIEEMIATNQLEKCLVVAVPVKNKRERLVLYRPKGSKHEAYKRFFAEELVSYIDSTYSTLPISGGRAILGASLGGTVSLEIAIQYPRTFRYVLTQSGAFYEGTIERVQHSTFPPDQLNVYLSIGTEETNVETSIGKLNLLEANQELRHVLEARKIPHVYKIFEGDHTWGHWQADIPNILKFIWQ